MDNRFDTLRQFDSIDNKSLSVVIGGRNKLAYKIGRGLGIGVNIISTLRGLKGGKVKYRPKH